MISCCVCFREYNATTVKPHIICHNNHSCCHSCFPNLPDHRCPFCHSPVVPNPQLNRGLLVALGQQSSIRTIPSNEFSFNQPIGSGTFGTVYASDWQGIPVAIKLVSLTNDARRRLNRELSFMQNLNHPLVVRVFGLTEYNGQIGIVMERGDTTLPSPSSLSEVTRESALNIVRAVKFLHSRGIIHGDIKPGNILLINGKIKLTDFGTARSLNGAQAPTQNAYTPAYAPLEAFNDIHSCQGDVYSLGVVLYEILCNQRAFDGDGHHTIFKKKQQGFIPPYIGNIPRPLKKIINRCLSTNPQLRPSIDEIIRVLESLVIPEQTVASTSTPESNEALPDVSRLQIPRPKRKPKVKPSDNSVRVYIARFSPKMKRHVLEQRLRELDCQFECVCAFRVKKTPGPGRNFAIVAVTSRAAAERMIQLLDGTIWHGNVPLMAEFARDRHEQQLQNMAYQSDSDANEDFQPSESPPRIQFMHVDMSTQRSVPITSPTHHCSSVCECGATVPNYRLEIHKQKECSLRPFPCQFCGGLFAAIDHVQHEFECSSRVCNNCKQRVRLSDDQKHTKSSCRDFVVTQSHEPVVRPEKRTEKYSSSVCECGVAVLERNLGHHKQNECSLRPLPCQFCRCPVSVSQHAGHEATCGSRTTGCNNCGKRVRLSDMQKHLASSCRQFVVGQLPQQVPQSRAEKGPHIFSAPQPGIGTPAQHLHGPPTFVSVSSQQRTSIPNPTSTTLPASQFTVSSYSRGFEPHPVPVAPGNRSNQVNYPRIELECDGCGRKFSNAAALQNHIFSECNMIPCEFCEELFQIDLIEQHQRQCIKRSY
ncbi:hypothetical protein RCL1_000668 [Eukaryota sp. TZLM3-RCL]